MSEDGRLYIPTYFDFVDSKAFTEVSGNAFKLYLKLRRYVCRARSGHSLSDFYIKGCLAVSGYLEQYANFFNVSKATISRWLKELEDAKFILTYRKAMKGRSEPNIWILGRVQHYEGSEYGTEAFFIDHDATAQEQDERAAETFDLARGEAMIASMQAVSSTVSFLKQSTEQLMKRQMKPSNIEEGIDKSNREENIPPSAEKSDLNTFFGDKLIPEQNPADEYKARIEAAVGKFEERRGVGNWADPPDAGGDDPWMETVKAFVNVTSTIPKSKKAARQWSRKIEELVKDWKTSPQTVAFVIGQKLESEFDWRTWGTPFSGIFQEDIDAMLGQHFNGGVKPAKPKGRAARSSMPDALEQARAQRGCTIEGEYVTL